ncbi:PREDICTED: chitotriosidase-1-like, partial [Priapulus caudatus]|uniref:Chitotriosidase-1-like n=1 Tax=Priapulus caudatus TaxID=37621 RepID=A0ABM1F767_PRICU
MMMMMMRLLLVGLTALAVLVGDRVLANHVGTYRVVCYFTNWSQYRPSPATFQPENIDPSLCTHIVFAFAVLNKRLQLIPHEWNDPDLYKRTFHTLNRTMNRPKLLLAVGGYKHGPVLLSKMAGNVYKRSQFINQTVPYLRRYNFDGIELDWEFPGEINRGGRAVDKKNFPLMLEELRRAFDAESAVTKRPRLLLTAAVAASSDLIDGGYDVKAIGSIVDYVTLMSYDYFGAWNNVAGHNAPLYEGYNQTAKYNVKWSVRKWLHE